jgi:hypothetical protein
MGIAKRLVLQGPLRKHETMAQGTPGLPAAKSDTRHDTITNHNETGTIITPGDMVQRWDTRHEGGDNHDRFSNLRMYGDGYRMRYKTRWRDGVASGIS